MSVFGQFSFRILFQIFILMQVTITAYLMLVMRENSLSAAPLCLLFLRMLIPASRDALMELRWHGLFSLRHSQTSDKTAEMRCTAGSLSSSATSKLSVVTWMGWRFGIKVESFSIRYWPAPSLKLHGRRLWFRFPASFWLQKYKCQR